MTNTAKATPVDRRIAFIHEATAPLMTVIRELGNHHPAADHPVWVEVADRIATEGPKLGRTARWQEACAWYGKENRDQHGPDALPWLVVQGQVWLANANI